MWIARLSALAASVLLAMPAAAQDGHSFTALAYATRVAGLSVMLTEADVEMDAAGYRVDIVTRTTGAYGVLFRGESRSLAQGLWAGSLVAPRRYAVDGAWRGERRHTLMEYEAGQPRVLGLEPPNEREREPVDSALQRETVDTISAAALLSRRVTTTGRCDGVTRTFDARRLSEVTARTAGWEVLDAPVPGLDGPALRCDFEGRLLAGFMLEGDRAEAGRPHKASAWLARLAPGGPMLPVRLRFENRWLGSATMLLTTASPGGAPIVRQRADAALAPLPR